ncbi:MAG: Uma2 family endonuclease [Roseiflexaceae bacterium]|mgnify:CR=1 FL=1|nr:Uma2 family endonuclease [Roseiflexaceae bacterium]
MTTDILPVAGPVTHLVPPIDGHWTIADYECLPNDGVRYELVHGELRIAPALGTDHQTASGYIFYFLMQQIQLAGHGRVFHAPIDLELGPDTIVQPDIVVVLNQSSAVITSQRIIGSPNLVIEIASPSTASYDRREKRDLYATGGVPEYWIVDPASRTIELLLLAGNVYRSEHIYRGKAIVPTAIIAGWNVATERLFGL